MNTPSPDDLKSGQNKLRGGSVSYKTDKSGMMMIISMIMMGEKTIAETLTTKITMQPATKTTKTIKSTTKSTLTISDLEQLRVERDADGTG